LHITDCNQINEKRTENSNNDTFAKELMVHPTNLEIG